jgi:pSer/pThr/pTyr-binding forkhead associated (FHA) protein
MVLDPDLELGYFGILAQRVYPQQEAPAAPVPAAAPTEALAYVPASAPADLKLPAPTEVIAAGEAEQLGLARRVIVVRAGEVVREFSQSRVVLGRGREADFRIDDPNVSRMHAALYWHEGRLMLDDLRSTNGTMVNGYPVTSTVLRPRDVIAIGESRITVEAK